MITIFGEDHSGGPNSGNKDSAFKLPRYSDTSCRTQDDTLQM